MWKHTSGFVITWFKLLMSQAPFHLCVPTNLPLGLASGQVSMSTEPLPVYVETDSDITASVGSKVVLPCGAQHLGTRQMTWKRLQGPDIIPLAAGDMMFIDDPSILVEHTKVKDADMYNLVIRNVTKAHGGLYSCQIPKLGRPGRGVMLNIVDASSGLANADVLDVNEQDGDRAQHTGENLSVTVEGDTTMGNLSTPVEQQEPASGGVDGLMAKSSATINSFTLVFWAICLLK